MSDDRFLDRLREEARPLRFEPDQMVLARLQARVRQQIASRPLSVSQLLVSWLRPVGMSLAALALAVSIIAGFEQQQHDASATALESITASADSPSFSEELLGGN